MKDETQGALERLKEIASRRDDGVAMCLWSEEARAILAHIADLQARAERTEYELRRWKEARSAQPDWEILWSEQVDRAEAAEAKVAAAEERGLVFNMLPDGRLDFCAIREGSRLWDGRVRAEAAEAREAALRAALEDKIARMAWDRFAPEHETDFDECAHKAEYLRFAADALAKAALPAEPAAEWIEAMARAIDPHGCNWENQLPGPLKDLARRQARRAYAVLARQMEGRDAK